MKIQPTKHNPSCQFFIRYQQYCKLSSGTQVDHCTGLAIPAPGRALQLYQTEEQQLNTNTH